MSSGRFVIVLGAGASLAAPAARPLFAWIREALTAPLDVDLDDGAWEQMAPEALLSRLASAGIDIDAELRRMLRGGSPNALHVLACGVLRRGGAVWTTNFDELVEAAADRLGVDVHRLLPGDDPGCACPRGHLIKIHGTLSSERVIARSEDVLLPLPPAWLARLADDFRDATAALVGYAGADIDLRTGLREALGATRSAVWFGMESDSQPLRRRFAGPLTAGTLQLRLSERPDLASLEWGRQHDLLDSLADDLWSGRASRPAGWQCRRRCTRPTTCCAPACSMTSAAASRLARLIERRCDTGRDGPARHERCTRAG